MRRLSRGKASPVKARGHGGSGKPAPGVMAQLATAFRVHGLAGPAERLLRLDGNLVPEVAAIAAELETFRRAVPSLHHSALHQLVHPGKLLRPLCVLLAGSLGRGIGSRTRNLAVAVELIHNATLLHDDVIDAAETRRGEASARALYGNPASVLSGDWLLIEALRRVRRDGDPELLDRTLSTIEGMIDAEAIQLARRGLLDGGRSEYFRIIEGKTGALFRLAFAFGARAGGLDRTRERALEEYGAGLGVAFQIVDDLLDINGDPALTGKDLLNDLREGKMTYPLLLALERDPELRPILEQALGDGTGAPLAPGATLRIAGTMAETGALHDARALAVATSRDALEGLRGVLGAEAMAPFSALAEMMIQRAG